MTVRAKRIFIEGERVKRLASLGRMIEHATVIRTIESKPLRLQVEDDRGQVKLWLLAGVMKDGE